MRISGARPESVQSGFAGYSTLVLWYLTKKGLRHCGGERKFLIRCQGPVLKLFRIDTASLPPCSIISTMRNQSRSISSRKFLKTMISLEHKRSVFIYL